MIQKEGGENAPHIWYSKDEFSLNKTEQAGVLHSWCCMYLAGWEGKSVSSSTWGVHSV